MAEVKKPIWDDKERLESTMDTLEFRVEYIGKPILMSGLRGSNSSSGVIEEDNDSKSKIEEILEKSGGDGILVFRGKKIHEKWSYDATYEIVRYDLVLIPYRLIKK